MSDLVIVRWIKKKAPYNIGETCGLQPEIAAKEIRLGTAVIAKKKDEKEPDGSSKKPTNKKDKKKDSKRKRVVDV